MTRVSNLETRLQAAVRDIELLRNDLRAAFDGLQQQATALAAAHGRADLALSKVEGIEGADLVKRVELLMIYQHQNKEEADERMENIERLALEDYRRAYQLPNTNAAEMALRQMYLNDSSGPANETMDEYEARRSNETAAERGDRPPERGETFTIIDKFPDGGG